MRSNNSISRSLALLLALLMVTSIFAFVNTSNTYAASSTRFSISGQTTPSVLMKGQSFSLKGVIKSTYKITSVKVGVVNSKGKWESAATYSSNSVNSKSFNIASSADSSVKFGKLSPGTYTYKVWVRDEKKKSKYLVSKQFTIATTPKFSISGKTVPNSIKKGSSFSLKGVVKSANKISEVKVGVCNSKGNWVSGATYTKTGVNATSFNIQTYADSSVKFGKLGAGTYTYRVWVKDITGTSKYVVKKKFTVSGTGTTSTKSTSSFKISGHNYPKSLVKGKSYSIKGKVSSKYKLKVVRVGVTNSKGSWVKGVNYKVNPKAKTFNIARADNYVKFGKLAAGTYYYKVWVKDSKNKSKYVLSKKFTVKKNTSTTTIASSTNKLIAISGGKRLKYNASVINAIGRQPYSGPCGIYSMAYARAVIDGQFTRAGYSSIHARIIGQYGLGDNCAYWWRAGGNSVYYSTKSSCYKVAYAQLNSGKPCILSLYNSATGNNHYVCVIGYTSGTTVNNVDFSRFIILDPGNGMMRFMRDCYSYKSYSTPQLITF